MKTWNCFEVMQDQYGRDYEQICMEWGVKLDRSTFKRIESELYRFHETMKEVQELRDDIIQSTVGLDDTGGGKGNLPGDPTGSMAQRILSDGDIQEKEQIIRAIQLVYSRMPEDKQRLLPVKYWSVRPKEKKNWEKIACELHIHRTTAIRWRDEAVNEIAKILGWV